MSYQFNIKDILLAILIIVLFGMIRSNNAKGNIIEQKEGELQEWKNDKHAQANQKLQQSMRVYRSCASEFISNLSCMDKAQHEIAEGKKLVNNSEKYYRIKEAKGTGFVDVHADSIIEFLSSQE